MLAILYVVVAGNYVGELFSCDLQRLLTHSVVCKHAIVLLGALFWVAEVTDIDTDTTFATILWRAIAIYALFVISTKTEWWALAPVLGLLIVDQIMRIVEAKSAAAESGSRREQVVRARAFIQRLCVIVLVAGFVAYAARQIRDHRGVFSVSKFVLGTASCKGV